MSRFREKFGGRRRMAVVALIAMLLVAIPVLAVLYDVTADDAIVDVGQGESLGRLLFEVAPEHADAFETALAGLPVAAIGEVRDDDRIQIIGLAGMPVVETIVAAVTHAWRGHLTS